MKRSVILIMISACFFMLVVLSIGNASVKQPIQYNHKKHIDAGLSCTDCHVDAETHLRASIPTLTDCMGCHEEAVTESSEEEVLRNMAADGVDYPWIQVTKLRPDVLFSHRRHVALANIECSTCHGAMENLEKPLSKAPIKLKMKFCMNCHEAQTADNDCIACHR